MSEAAGIGAAAALTSGADVIVTGTSPIFDEPGINDEDGNGSPALENRRRHPETWFAFTSYCCATTDTDAPGANAAVTISRFNASGHRLRRRLPPLVSISAIVGTSLPAATNQRQPAESTIAQIPTRRCSPEDDDQEADVVIFAFTFQKSLVFSLEATMRDAVSL